MRHLGKTLLTLALLALPVAASATAVVGGNTRVAFGPAISGLEAGLTGTASLVGGSSGLTVNFGITGGELDAALAGSIRHDGSGVTLSNGTNTLGLGNFVIDTTSGFLLGDAALNGTVLGTGLELFSFDLGSVSVAQLTDLNNPLLSLFITATASGALSTAFGLDDTTGVVIGAAATAPQLAAGAIPEPATWALLIIGFGAVGTAMRRRQSTNTVAA
jgi:hypothetical protein